MGTRTRYYIAVAPGIKVDVKAPWIAIEAAEVLQDERGTLVMFEENIQPLHTRLPDSPGAPYLADLDAYLQRLHWLAAIGTQNLRIVGVGEAGDLAGEFRPTAFLDHPWVLEIETELREALGPEYSCLPPP